MVEARYAKGWGAMDPLEIHDSGGEWVEMGQPPTPLRPLPMLPEKPWVGGEFAFEDQLLAFELQQPGKAHPGPLALGRQAAREVDHKLIVYPHEAAIEGLVMEGVEAKAVSWVEAIFGAFGPRQNVAGDE